MNIIRISGGLGNQITQYIFSRYIEIVNKRQDIVHDKSFFHFVDAHNGFELDKVFPNINLNLFENKFTPDVWQNILQICIDSKTKTLPNILIENGFDIAIVADDYWFTSDGKLKAGLSFDGEYHLVYSNLWNDPNYFIHEKLKDDKNAYYFGVWFTDTLGNAIKKEIEHELQFPELQHQENIDYRDAILASDIAVGLHVRRGDFITVNKNITNDKYSVKVRDVKRTLARSNSPKPNFFVFSDDLDWCMENTSQLGFSDSDNITFIQGNGVDGRNYIDMQLMTYCDYLVHNSVSSFCLAAQMISTKPIIRIPC